MKEFMVHKYILHKTATLLDNKKCRGYLILHSHKYGWMLYFFIKVPYMGNSCYPIDINMHILLENIYKGISLGSQLFASCFLYFYRYPFFTVNILIICDNYYECWLYKKKYTTSNCSPCGVKFLQLKKKVPEFKIRGTFVIESIFMY